MPAQNIVFIDSRVASYQTLVASLDTNTEWHLLSAGQDGIGQMQDILANRGGLDSIQVISHGSAGTLYLGSSVLNSANLASYQNQLQTIGASLSATGDILLYGCNVAQGTIGASFVDSLARITGADVAASDDLTGPIYLGGDAVLETASGSVEAATLALGGLQQTLAVNTAPTFTFRDGRLTTNFGQSFGTGSPDTYVSSIFQKADEKLVVVYQYSSTKVGLARFHVDGKLDSTFSGDGKLTINFEYPESASSIFQQADGKLVVAGQSGSDFALVRYNTDGTLDTGFSSDGKLTTNFGSSESAANSIFQQADGKLVVAGQSGSDFALVRYNTDGTLDTGFSSDGKLITDFGSDDGFRCVMQQADGKLVVAGYTYNSSVGTDFALARYNTDGMLDTSFSGDGKLTIDFGVNDDVKSIFQQTDGKLVVAGNNSSTSVALVRYNADGTLDTSFSGDGKLTASSKLNDSNGSKVFQQVDGKLIVMWSNNYDCHLTRYNTNGTLDTSFSGDGMLATGFGVDSSSSKNMVQQNDGKLVIGGQSGNDFALARYNIDGTLDNSFDDDGKLKTSFGYVTSILQQADGKLVVTGPSTTVVDGSYSTNFPLARYNLDGSLDSNFSAIRNTLPYNATFTEYKYDWDTRKVPLSPTVRIFDAELGAAGNYGGSSVTLTRHGGANVHDVFDATGTLFSLTEGSYFSVDSVTIGRVMINSAGTLKLIFNSNATQSRIDQALCQIGYANSSDAPPPSVQIDWTFSDGNSGTQGSGGALSVTGSSTVTIVGRNDAPVNHSLLQGQTALANTPFSYTLPVGAFSDPDMEVLTYSVSMADGSDVPHWLKINATTGSLSGTPAALDIGSYRLGIVAHDPSGTSSWQDDFTLTVTAASKTIKGSSGNDSLAGQAGNDILIGYAGNDTLDGGLGSDNMDGGNGNDLYYVDNSNDVVVESSASGGTDTVYSSLPSYTLGANVENGRINTANAANLTGNGLNNILYAGAGDNTLDGQVGVDTVSYLYASGGVSVSLATTAAQDTDSSGFDRLLNIENLTGSAYNDQLSGNAGANVINGGTGADIMIGRDGDDSYYVDHVDDIVIETSSSAGGQDIVYSTLKNHTLTNNVENGRINTTGAASLTGNGLANILYAGAGDNTLDGGAGTDTVSYLYGLVSGAKSGVNISLTISSPQNTGRSGTDKLVKIENLTGSSLNDTLTGSTGNNVLDGGADNDSLSGGDGADTLIGGAGKDTLVGGKSNDVFDFNALSEMGTTSTTWDVISDFVRGDKIDLSTIDANMATKATNEAFNKTLVDSKTSFTTAGQLKLASGVLYGNTDTDADAEFAIQLTGITALTATDFVL